MNTNNITALRKHITTFYGDHLPEQIRYRDRAGRELILGMYWDFDAGQWRNPEGATFGEWEPC